MSTSYTWGSAPVLTFTVSDSISRSSSSSTSYSGYLTVTLGGCSGGSYFGYYINVTVAGTTVQLKGNSPSTWSSGTYSHKFYVSGSSTASTVSITGTLSTNAERGSATFTYKASIGTYSGSSSSGSSSGSSSPTAGASSISLSAASCKLGESVTVSLNRGYSGYTHNLTYSVGGSSYTLANSVGTSVTFTPPTSLIDIVNSGGTRCVITATTYYGSTSKGTTTANLTLYPPDGANPTVSDGWVSVERDNSAIPDVDAWVKGYSKARIVFDESKVTGNYDATIAGFSIRYGGTVTEAEDGAATTGTLADTNATVFCTVTDSRGNYTTEPVIVPTLAYAPPTVTNISVYRSDDAMLPVDEGVHITAKATAGCAALDGANSVTLTASYRALNAETFGAEMTLENDTLTLISGDADISTMQSYVVRLTAKDALGNTTSAEKGVSTKAVTFHLKSGGQGAAFGKYAEEDVLDCQWPAKFMQSVSIAEALTINGKTLTEFIQEVVTPMLPTTLSIDAIYPVGSIYMSLSEDANPDTLFPGTLWERITGRFLLASSDGLYELNTTGGEAQVTLTTSEMPSHNHTGYTSTDGNHRHAFPGRSANGDNGPSAESYASSDDARTLYVDYGGEHNHTITITSAGGGAAHENMPPYLVVHMWKRTY